MVDPSLYMRAVEDVRPVLAGVTESQFDQPTPCDLWSVRDLMNHLVANPYFLSSCLSGASILESAIFAVSEDDLPMLASLKPGQAAEYAPRDMISEQDGDWEVVLETGLETLRPYLADTNDLGRIVEAGIGKAPAQEVIDANICEWIIHGWDLCTALGQNVVHPPDLLEAAADVYARLGSARLRVQPRAAAAGDPLDRMLALSKRTN